MVDMVDPTTGKILSPLHPLNKSANANGLRRARTPTDSRMEKPTSSKIAPYLQKLVAEYAATGLPQSYLPKDELEKGDE